MISGFLVPTCMLFLSSTTAKRGCKVLSLLLQIPFKLSGLMDCLSKLKVFFNIFFTSLWLAKDWCLFGVLFALSVPLLGVDEVGVIGDDGLRKLTSNFVVNLTLLKTTKECVRWKNKQLCQKIVVYLKKNYKIWSI